MSEPQHEQRWYDDTVIPMMLAAGRLTYGQAIRDALSAAGFDDMPRQGSRIVGGIARNNANLRDVSGLLGVSKQAASQLVDTLVMRGYVERIADTGDRRRMEVALTDRGQAAAAEINDAVNGVDAELLERVGARNVAALRQVLGVLIEMGHDPLRGRSSRDLTGADQLSPRQRESAEPARRGPPAPARGRARVGPETARAATHLPVPGSARR